jgi:hypothetical protein
MDFVSSKKKKKKKKKIAFLKDARFFFFCALGFLSINYAFFLAIFAPKYVNFCNLQLFLNNQLTKTNIFRYKSPKILFFLSLFENAMGKNAFFNHDYLFSTVFR